jgi:hypothetical protein
VKLKVYGVCLDRRNRLIVCARSNADAVRILSEHGEHTSLYRWNQYSSETSNATELALAVERGDVFTASMNDHTSSYVRVAKPERPA